MPRPKSQEAPWGPLPITSTPEPGERLAAYASITGDSPPAVWFRAVVAAAAVPLRTARVTVIPHPSPPAAVAPAISSAASLATALPVSATLPSSPAAASIAAAASAASTRRFLLLGHLHSHLGRVVVRAQILVVEEVGGSRRCIRILERKHSVALALASVVRVDVDLVRPLPERRVWAGLSERQTGGRAEEGSAVKSGKAQAPCGGQRIPGLGSHASASFEQRSPNRRRPPGAPSRSRPGGGR